MALSLSNFVRLNCEVWLILVMFWGKSSGDKVRIMVVTPNPYGASAPGATFSCLSSDESPSNIILAARIFRYILRGSTYDSLGLPASSNTLNINNRKTVSLPATTDAQGMYNCEAYNSGFTTKVPIAILAQSRNMQPLNGQFTTTANVGESVTLAVEVLNYVGNADTSNLRWEKQSASPEGFQIVKNGGFELNLNPVRVADAGVYATFWEGARNNFLFSLTRLIVRECSNNNKWGPPFCTGICDNCYNGGICDDKTGECVCRPGFTGPNCITACGADKFGWDCEHTCGYNQPISSCSSSVFCMPDPVGCSCMNGWMGAECNTQCPHGRYGAGCTETCRCATGTCNMYTGECHGACLDGWTGPGCKVPVTCNNGYFGINCTGKCHNCNCDPTAGCEYQSCFPEFWGPNCDAPCNCLNDAACDKETGRCDADPNTGLSLCIIGYVSSTGNNQDNCQLYAGCFEGCTKTCHCKEVVQCDYMRGFCQTGCSEGWDGPSCQIGIVGVSYKKTNPGQTLSLTCTVPESDIVSSNGQIKLYLDGTLNEVGRKGTDQILNMFRIVNFEIDPPVPKDVSCCLFYVYGVDTKSICTTLTSEYYILPFLGKAPLIHSKSTTSVTLQWNAWDPDVDIGDGPVIMYRLYYQDSTTSVILLGATFSPSDSGTVISGSLTALQPNTTYYMFVTVVRPGEEGEGSGTPYVTVTTLPIMPTAISFKTTASTQKLTSRRQASADDTDTMTSAPLTMRSVSADAIPMTMTMQGNDNQLFIIIAAIVALVLTLIVIIALIYFVKRRNGSKAALARDAEEIPSETIASKLAPESDDELMTAPNIGKSLSSHTLSNMYDNAVVDMEPVKVADLVIEVKNKPEQKKPAVLPELQPLSRPKEDLPPPIPTESPAGGASGANAVSTSTIQRKLRVEPVNVRDFVNYMKLKKRVDLRREWESLPKDLARPTTVAKKLENKGKNRFRNVVAYDHSRVVLEPLDDDPNSDYINACFIKSQDYNNPRAYIASQGPAETTIGDYWRLVWQENISVMVMACNTFENGRLKCLQYWPDMGKPLLVGDFTITPESDEKKEDYYTVRKFTIAKEGEDSKRNIIQFHYTEWPDKDVPRHCTPVLKFIKEVNKHYDGKASLLIHCSAGAGRTGAIISIHAMMQMAEEKGQVDIYNYVFAMRNSRPHIVQTSEQYMFVHDAMLEYLFCKNTFIDAGAFANKVETLQLQNQGTGNTNLQDEFEILDMISPRLGSDKTKESLKGESVIKLRSADSLPADLCRPYLMTPRDDDDMSPYINAAYTDGYKKNDLFITTQMPMADTVVDLWRMVYDYNCTSIVQLNAMDSDDEDCPQFWPEGGTQTYGPFLVSLLDKESTADCQMRTLELVYTKRDVKSPIRVRHFQYMTWPMGDEKPATSDGILQLISAVEKWQKTLEQSGPIVVMCMNAAGRTGAFCAIQKCLDQVREEQGADVLQNVKELRIHRTNMVDTSVKYLFCYDTILQYLKGFDDYATKKKYQNLVDLSEPIHTTNNKKATKEEAPSVMYGNQKIIQEHMKAKEAAERQDGDLCGIPNVPSIVAPASAEGVPSSRRTPALIKPKPMVLSTKPKPPSKRPKATNVGQQSPSTDERGTSGASGGIASKASTKKQEQMNQNVMFDSDDTQF